MTVDVPGEVAENIFKFVRSFSAAFRVSGYEGNSTIRYPVGAANILDRHRVVRAGPRRAFYEHPVRKLG